MKGWIVGMTSNFKQKVLAVVKKISKGKILSYKQVAQRAGSSKAYQAVGNIMNQNYDIKVPCHRVIRGDGNIGGYRLGVKKKKEILDKERVK